MTLDPPNDPASKTLAPTNAQQRSARARTSRQVSAIIARRAAAAGLSPGSYFNEILAGHAPRITRAEADLEPMT
jgi:hypothetical protein